MRFLCGFHQHFISVGLFCYYIINYLNTQAKLRGANRPSINLVPPSMHVESFVQACHDYQLERAVALPALLRRERGLVWCSHVHGLEACEAVVVLPGTVARLGCLHPCNMQHSSNTGCSRFAQSTCVVQCSLRCHSSSRWLLDSAPHTTMRIGKRGRDTLLCAVVKPATRVDGSDLTSHARTRMWGLCCMHCSSKTGGSA